MAERVCEFGGGERLPIVKATAAGTLSDAGLERSGLLRACIGCTGPMDTRSGRGAAKGLDDIVCVLAGECIGAGIMVGGNLMRGHAGAAGEMAFLGGGEAAEGAHGIAQYVRLLSGETPEAVFAAAGRGDPEALAIVERVERWAGSGIVMTAQIVNPEVVVLSGGVARAGEALLGPLRERRSAAQHGLWRAPQIQRRVRRL